MTWILRNPMTALLIAAGFLLGLMNIRSRWLSDRLDRANERNATLQAEVEAHDRINKADTGSGLSDADRRKHLREFAKRNSR